MPSTKYGATFAARRDVVSVTIPHLEVLTLTSCVARLFNDPILSDIKIRQIYKGETKEYFAHKAILSAHSKWFMRAFTGRFKVEGLLSHNQGANADNE